MGEWKGVHEKQGKKRKGGNLEKERKKIRKKMKENGGGVQLRVRET